jgi:hypothetical protein
MPRIAPPPLGREIEGGVFWWLDSFSAFSGAGFDAMTTSYEIGEGKGVKF